MTKQIRNGLFKVFSLTLVAAGSAHAALPAGIEDAIDAVQADGTTLVGILAAAGATVYLIYRLLSRFGMKL